jgi:hypothetical protein
MKNLIINRSGKGKRFSLLFFLMLTTAVLSNASFAQTANLNVTLSDVLSFTVTQPANLDVIFDTEEKYNKGITSLATDHISVVSSRGYVIKAMSGMITGTAALTANSVSMTSAIGTTNVGNIAGITFESNVILPAYSGVAATIVIASNSSWQAANSTNKFNISYLIGASGVFAGKKTGLNVIPIIYTITQD